MDRLREQVAFRLELGASLGEVDNELIDGAVGLNEDEQAALWLYAWAYPRQGRRQDRLLAAIGG